MICVASSCWRSLPAKGRCAPLRRNFLSVTTPEIFEQVNRVEWLDKIKTAEGYAKVAGFELILLDCVRYFHKASGMDGLAQVVKDIGAKAVPRKLAKIPGAYLSCGDTT